MRQDQCYEAACETMQDMARQEYGDPYAGHRAILGPAMRVPAARRKATLNRVLGDLFALTYYSRSSMWNTSQEYRRVLVEQAIALCDEIEQSDRAMRELSARQVKRARGKTAPVAA